MIVNEVFESIQGEGPDIGRYSTFVRLAGCNRNCEFCDTKYARTNGFEVTLESIADTITDRGNNNVVFTGGEPALQFGAIDELIGMLPSSFRVSIETNGTIKFPVDAFKYVVVSPKQFEDWEYWIDKDVFFKLVVNEENIDKMFSMVTKIKDSLINPVYFMPEGMFEEEVFIRSSLIVKKLSEYKIDGILSPRLHIMLGVR